MKTSEASREKAFVVSQYGKEKEYWLDKLSGIPAKSFFPYDHGGRQNRLSASMEEAAVGLPRDLSARLISLGTGKDHRVHMVLLAVLVMLLERYTGGSDIVVGIPIAKQEQDLRFINTALALRCCLPTAGAADITFKELILQVRQTLLEAVEHQNYPLDILVYQLGLSPGGNQDEEEFPLFDVVLLLENIHDKKYIEHLNCNVVFSFVRSGDAVSGKLEYNPLRYERSTVERMVDHFTCLLAAALVDIDQPLSALEMLTPQEKQRLLYDFNDTGAEDSRDKNLIRLFADQVEKTPDRAALIDITGGAGTVGPRCLTYRELMRRAGQMARRLRESGVKPGIIAALAAERSLEMVTGILAVLTAGGACMPIVPDFPPARIQWMLEDSSACVLLIPRQRMTSINTPATCRVLEIDCSPLTADTDFPGCDRDLSPGNLSYIIYTSGSTGRPKGVMVEHRSIPRLVINPNYMELSADSRILQNCSPAFDVSIFELWGALLNGGQSVLADKRLTLDAGSFERVLKQQCVNVLFLTPSIFNRWVQQNGDMFSGLQWLLVGAEVVSPRHMNRVRGINPRLKLFNVYGPTENSTYSTAYLIERDFAGNIPIGRPISNSTAYILDAAGRMQPVGVTGELYVGGCGLARGYMNNPELTAEKFVFMSYKSYGSYRTSIPKKIYKTGDLARWLPDGNLEFLGRIDRQVKVRGHRIELGEIENCLKNRPGIKDALVVIGGDGDQSYLCAYFLADRDVMAAELRDHLREALPEYMVPSYFVRMETFPCGPTGKVDRAVLPDPKTVVETGKNRQPPTNDVEAAVLEAWAEVLGIEPGKIGIDDDFFDLGGNSINILKVQERLTKRFEQDISLSNMFIGPTIKSLSAIIMTHSLEKELQYVVKLNNSSSKKNIFIFHPLNGMAYPYKELAKLLEDRFNVYGIQARGLTREAALPQSCDEMLADYLPEITAVQPTGPYIFAGYCIGNELAYEATVEMENRGEPVEKLIVVDATTFLPEKIGPLERLRFLLEFFLFYRHVAQRDFEPAQSLSAAPEEQRLMDRVEANNFLLINKQYRFKRTIHSPVIHIGLKSNFSMRLARMSWRKMSSAGVQFFETPGHHNTVLAHPYVDSLAGIIENAVI